MSKVIAYFISPKLAQDHVSSVYMEIKAVLSCYRHIDNESRFWKKYQFILLRWTFVKLAGVLSFLASYKKSFKENGLEIRDLFI